MTLIISAATARFLMKVVCGAAIGAAKNVDYAEGGQKFRRRAAINNLDDDDDIYAYDGPDDACPIIALLPFYFF
jgi:hypothetical protein